MIEDESIWHNRFNDLFKHTDPSIKFIFHAGTQKTGTTSLQFYLYENRSQLLERGILYPSHITKTASPKHLWIPFTLKRLNIDAFLENLKKALIEMRENTHTVFFSAEGIYVHWWDMPKEAKHLIELMAHHVDVEWWTWFRDPVSFTESFYIQVLKNPQLEHTPIYGQDISLGACLNDPWFLQHLDYLGYLTELQEEMPSVTIRSFLYQPNKTISQACHALDIPFEATNELQKNQRLSVSAMNALRMSNRKNTSPEEKKHIVHRIIDYRDHAQERNEFKCTSVEREQVLSFFHNQSKLLNEKYDLTFFHEPSV